MRSSSAQACAWLLLLVVCTGSIGTDALRSKRTLRHRVLKDVTTTILDQEYVVPEMIEVPDGSTSLDAEALVELMDQLETPGNPAAVPASPQPKNVVPPPGMVAGGAAPPPPAPLYNVALIPGVMGTRLQVRSKTTTALCSNTVTRAWYDMWINVHAISNNLPAILGGGGATQAQDRCVLGLVDPAVTTVDVRVHGGDPRFGSENTVLDAITVLQAGGLIQTLAPSLVYFHPIVRGLERNGLVRDTDIVGLGYDWRFAFDSPQHDAWFTHLKNRISANTRRNGRKTVIIAHSMGNYMWLQFLKRMETSPDGQTWLSANIHRYLGVAPPMAGSSSVFEHLIGGSALLASAGIQRPTLRAIARSLEPVLAALSPHPQFYSNGTGTGSGVPVLKIGTDFYTIATAAAALTRAGATAGFSSSWAGAIARVRPTTTPPAAITSYTLPTIFYYATGKATPLVIHYPAVASGDFSGATPTYQTGPGDGTVPASSARAYASWRTAAGAAVRVTPFVFGVTQVTAGSTIYERVVTEAGALSDHQSMLTQNWNLIRELVSQAVNGGTLLLTAEAVMEPAGPPTQVADATGAGAGAGTGTGAGTSPALATKGTGGGAPASRPVAPAPARPPQKNAGGNPII